MGPAPRPGEPSEAFGGSLCWECGQDKGEAGRRAQALDLEPASWCGSCSPTHGLRDKPRHLSGPQVSLSMKWSNIATCLPALLGGEVTDNSWWWVLWRAMLPLGRDRRLWGQGHVGVHVCAPVRNRGWGRGQAGGDQRHPRDNRDNRQGAISWDTGCKSRRPRALSGLCREQHSHLASGETEAQRKEASAPGHGARGSFPTEGEW